MTRIFADDGENDLGHSWRTVFITQANRQDTCSTKFMRKRTIRGQWMKWMLYLLFMSTIIWTVYLLIDRRARVDGFRNCRVPWPTLGYSNNISICLTTLSDEKISSVYSRAAPKDFSHVLELTWPNRYIYAQKHNYTIFNASDVLDTTRPASWSKLLAVRRAFDQGCDWVFWMDADSLIMNSNIRLEDILPSGSRGDFILTVDVTGYNAGMWMMRRSEWSMEFLDEWWAQSDFVRKPGDPVPGDNRALKTMFRRREIDMNHVLVAPQCSFNSYFWKNFDEMDEQMRRKWFWTERQYYIQSGQYRKGDFVVHFAGVTKKVDLIHRFEKEVI